MEFTLDNSLEYIKVHHPILHYYIDKKYIYPKQIFRKSEFGRNFMKSKHFQKWDKSSLRRCLLKCSDFFILSFVKYFNIDITFFSPYIDNRTFTTLLNSKFYTSFYLLSNNDGYKIIDWNHCDGFCTYFSYLINNSLCIDMIKELVNNNPTLLEFDRKYPFDVIIHTTSLQHLLMSNQANDLSSDIKHIMTSNPQNILKIDDDYYCETYRSGQIRNFGIHFKNDEIVVNLDDLDFIKTNEFVCNEKIKFYKNLQDLMIFLHKKSIENNIILQYNKCPITGKNKGISYHANNFDIFKKYLIDGQYICNVE